MCRLAGKEGMFIYCVPRRTYIVREHDHYITWKRYTETGDFLDYIRATQEKNQLKEMNRNLRANFEHDLARNINFNPKAFWKYNGTKFKAKSKLGDLLNSNRELTCDDTEMDNILNSTFTSVFSRENTKYKRYPNFLDMFLLVLPYRISQQIVENKLSKLKTNISSAQEGFHSRVLKETVLSVGLLQSFL